MDRDWQNALFESWADSDVALRRWDSDDTQTDARPPSHSAKGSKTEFPMIRGSKEDKVQNGETGMRTEPPSPQPRTPLKKRSALTRLSAEVFRSPVIDINDNKNKQSRISTSDDASIHTIDSRDERRLSDRVRKAWRGVTGQRLVDPLEQWMAKHSGGTLKDMPVNRGSREPSDGR